MSLTARIILALVVAIFGVAVMVAINIAADHVSNLLEARP